MARVAREHDQKWLWRQQVPNTQLLLFVIRLAFATDGRGNAPISGDLWDQCRQLGVYLPQERPVLAAASGKARAKAYEDVFHRTHQATLAEADPHPGCGRAISSSPSTARS